MPQWTPSLLLAHLMYGECGRGVVGGAHFGNAAKHRVWFSRGLYKCGWFFIGFCFCRKMVWLRTTTELQNAGISEKVRCGIKSFDWVGPNLEIGLSHVNETIWAWSMEKTMRPCFAINHQSGCPTLDQAQPKTFPVKSMQSSLHLLNNSNSKLELSV